MSDIREEINAISAELAVKIPQLYQLGRTDEHEAFWDSALNNATSFIGRFAGRAWNAETFRPTKDLNITGGCNYCFYNHGSGANFLDFPVKVTMKPTSALYMCQFSNIKGAEIDFSNCADLAYTFDNCSSLETLKLKLKEDGTNTFTGTFTGCNSLKNLIIESGMIGRSINLQWSTLLDTDCLANIIESKLANFIITDEHGKYTFKISDESWNALNEKYPNPQMMGDWQTIVTTVKGWNI